MFPSPMSQALKPLPVFNTLRERVAQEALSWLGTPYLPGGRVKGAGCDCGTLLIEVLLACGLLDKDEVDKELQELGYLSCDWFHNTNSEKYFRKVIRFARKISEGRCYPTTQAPIGSIVLTKVASSHVWNHGGIVVKWPRIVHAVSPRVVEVDAARDWFWTGQEISVFDAFGENA